MVRGECVVGRLDSLRESREHAVGSSYGDSLNNPQQVNTKLIRLCAPQHIKMYKIIRNINH